MPSRSVTAAVLGAVAVASLAACTSTEAGTPAPGSDSSTGGPPPGTITTEQAGQPTVQVPPRPKALPLDGAEPCSWFTKAQQEQLKISREPRSRTSADVYKAPQCVLANSSDQPYYSYYVTAITTEGIAAWLDGKRVVTSKLVAVGGFPAVDFYPETTGDATGIAGCNTTVDVADGQQLMVSLIPITTGVMSQEQECQMTEQAAALAVSTLQSAR